MVDSNEDFAFLDPSDPEFADKIWDAYYKRLRAAVRERVRQIRRAAASETEVAHSALRTFLRRAQENQFPSLKDDDELWRLLKTIAIRKAGDQRKKLRAQKRGGNHALLNQSDPRDDSSSVADYVQAAPGDAPSPSAEIEVSELFNAMLSNLPDDRHRDLILLKLQGASVAMIAEHLSTTSRTVQRMMRRIEDEWKQSFLES